MSNVKKMAAGMALPGMALPNQMVTGPKPMSRVLFDKYDKDRTGTIDVAEFKLLCYDFGYFLSESELKDAVGLIDKDGNGTISYQEFVSWWSSADRFKSLHLDEDSLKIRHKAAEVFQRYDSDKSGQIDKDEFAGFYTELKKEGLTTKTMDACLQDLDTDGDGRISFNEYIDYLQRQDALPIKTLLASEFADIVQTKKNLQAL